MLVVVELAATLGDRQHQEERKDRLSDLSKEDSQQSTYLVLFYGHFTMQVEIKFIAQGANVKVSGLPQPDGD